MEKTNEIISFNELVVLGMVSMLFLALGIVSIFSAFKKRIIRQQSEFREKESIHQRELLRAILLGQEKERQRLGKDLHDEVGALLSTTRLYLGHLDYGLSNNTFTKTKEKAMALLSETMLSVRTVSHDLRPVVLEQLGLMEAIGNSVEHLKLSSKIQVNFVYKVSKPIDKEYEVNWYRIIQELISNTIKHAQSQHITLHFSEKNDMLSVMYKDDGIGLADTEFPINGLGLRNIESRLSLMQGHWEPITNKNKGFAVQMTSAFTP